MTIATEWERTQHYIGAALARSPGYETLEDVRRMVGTGAYMLWTGENCAAVTRIDRYSQRLVLVLVHAGGDKAELIDVLEPKIAAFAVEWGCDAIMLEGREGWKREGEKRGYRLAYVVMIKDLKQ